MKEAPSRVAFSPGEFAELFGKSQTWGYRQIYAGKVKAITEHGRILIPAAEVEAILGTASIYGEYKPKAPKSKEQIQKLVPKLKGVWQVYLQNRRGDDANQVPTQGVKRPHGRKPSWNGKERQAALARLLGKKESRSE